MRVIKFIRQTAAVCLATVFMFSSVVSAESLSDMKKKSTEISKNVQSTKNYISELNKEKSAALNELDAFDRELNQVCEDLDTITQNLEDTTTLLEKTQTQLSEAEQKRDTQYENFKLRVRLMYENGKIGYLQVLLEAESVNDFLNRSEYIDRIIQSDAELLEELHQSTLTIEQLVGEISEQKQAIEKLKEQQEEYKQYLEDMMVAKSELIYSIDSDEVKYKQMMDEMDKSLKDINDKIKKQEAIEEAARVAKAKEEAAKAAKVVYNGVMGWPVKGYTKVTSDYGNRINPISKKKEFHTGIDIGAPKGTPILAASDGTVIFAGTQNGFGYTVIISHGNGISTMYGHNSKLNVKNGQEVKKGETIALCGSTGYSTGPHLHFEVRENGNAVNPMKYLK